MKKAFIFGINGKMGKMLCETAGAFGYTVVGGFDIYSDSPTVYTDVNNAPLDYDVIIDFSRPASLSALVTLVERKRAPVVIATTGYNDSELMTIRMLSARVPVFMSGNMSAGIAAVKAAAKTAQKVLGNAFDIEIVEKHHNQKVDSPSGTALLLADALAPREKQVTGRMGKREHGELGISSVRGGGVVGEHEVGFYGEDEIVTISHSARSRKLFAAGAFKAADYILQKAPGMYNMDGLTEALLESGKKSDDLTFHTEHGRFNYRVGAIIINDGKLLATRNSHAPYYYSVGGRVKFGETAEAAVLREVKEETGLDMQIDRLVYIHQNYFVEETTNEKFHELSLFFLMKPCDKIKNIKCRSTTEAGYEEGLEWLPVNKLSDYYIYPDFLPAELAAGLPQTVKVMTTRE